MTLSLKLRQGASSHAPTAPGRHDGAWQPEREVFQNREPHFRRAAPQSRLKVYP